MNRQDIENDKTCERLPHLWSGMKKVHGWVGAAVLPGWLSNSPSGSYLIVPTLKLHGHAQLTNTRQASHFLVPRKYNAWLNLCQVCMTCKRCFLRYMLYFVNLQSYASSG